VTLPAAAEQMYRALRALPCGCCRRWDKESKTEDGWTQTKTVRPVPSDAGIRSGRRAGDGVRANDCIYWMMPDVKLSVEISGGIDNTAITRPSGIWVAKCNNRETKFPPGGPAASGWKRARSAAAI